MTPMVMDGTEAILLLVTKRFATSPQVSLQRVRPLLTPNAQAMMNLTLTLRKVATELTQREVAAQIGLSHSPTILP